MELGLRVEDVQELGNQLSDISNKLVHEDGLTQETMLHPLPHENGEDEMHLIEDERNKALIIQH